MNEGPVLVFDGVCHLCDRAVRFVLPRDRKGRFRYAPLQSAAAGRLLAPFGIDAARLESVVLMEGGKAYMKSDAALRVAAGLGGIWTLARVFLVVPRPIRDWVYDWIARNRFRWFGKSTSCLMPAPEYRNRFLE